MIDNSYDKNQIERPIILIAEDHDGLRASICNLVRTNFPNSDILEARDGEEAVVIALAQQPDIILMDIKMPRIDGIEATRHIKSKFPFIHVVIITICENPEYQLTAEAAGASAYVLKSEIVTHLVPVLRNMLPQ